MALPLVNDAAVASAAGRSASSSTLVLARLQLACLSVCVQRLSSVPGRDIQVRPNDSPVFAALTGMSRGIGIGFRLIDVGVRDVGRVG